MDGMFTWLKVCVEELNVSEGLLEGNIEQLIDAMMLPFVQSPIRGIHVPLINFFQGRGAELNSSRKAVASKTLPWTVETSNT